MALPRRTLGHDGPEVGAIGYGAMGLSWAYGNREGTDPDAVIGRALDLGCTLIDTADVYGPFHNEVSSATRSRVAATRSCWPPSAGWSSSRRGDPGDRARRAARAHPRGDRRLAAPPGGRPRRPLLPAPPGPRGADRGVRRRAEGVVAAGKAKHIGLSEVTVDELERANAIHPITAVQSELRLWTRDPLQTASRTSAPARHRVRPVLAAGPRVPHRPPATRRARGRRRPPQLAALPARGDGRQPADRRRRRRGRRAPRGRARPDRAGLGPRAGRARRPDPRDQAPPVPGGERRRGRRPADLRGPRRCSTASRRRSARATERLRSTGRPPGSRTDHHDPTIVAMRFDFAQLLLDVLERRASDLHITAGSHPKIRVRGRLTSLEDYPVLDPTDTREIIYGILSNDQRQRLETDWQLDFAYAIPGTARFRVNAYMQRSAMSAAFRLIPSVITKIDDLGLPPVVHELLQEAARPRPRDRPDGLGQVDLAGRDDRRDQRDPRGAHPHDRGPDRVPALAQEVHGQPARAGLGRRRASAPR